MNTVFLEHSDLRIDTPRLAARLDALAQVGAIDGGGVNRLAFTDADRDGRNLVIGWMRDLAMDIRIDGIGNVIATLSGRDASLAPIMIGSHIDSVRTGGRFDGTLGVCAGLEVVETLKTAGVTLERSIEVAYFSDEEGSRYPPDALGSMVYCGHRDLESALDTVGIDGTRLGDELARIGYAGPTPSPGTVPHAFLELHIEQGPVLEHEGITIGVVTGVQGISWQTITVSGQSNHAGTTPMALRRDAAVVAARIAVEVREIVRTVAIETGTPQVGNVGSIRTFPGLVNVVAASATLTVDLRNTDDAALTLTEIRLRDFCAATADAENLAITEESTARSRPVSFDPHLIDLVARTAELLGYSHRRMPSGAAHDAQEFATICRSAMIFVPSVGGLSHNVGEFTELSDIGAGADVLLQVVFAIE